MENLNEKDLKAAGGAIYYSTENEYYTLNGKKIDDPWNHPDAKIANDDSKPWKVLDHYGNEKGSYGSKNEAQAAALDMGYSIDKVWSPDWM